MDDILERICADKREFLKKAKSKESLADLEDRAQNAPRPRGFAAALDEKIEQGGLALIAEIKKASPSAGLIRSDFDPEALARAYEEGGAACLSVLTDEKYFQGTDYYLTLARGACKLPILRKDFMVDPWQITESRALGADCILLILAVLSDLQAKEMEDAARDYGMDVLIEVHDEAEFDRALRLSSPLIGVNNRNLKTMKTDISTASRLASRFVPGRTLVAESGLKTHDDLQNLAKFGVKRFLIGETLMRQSDVLSATRAILGL